MSTKISNLPAYPAPLSTDVVPIDDLTGPTTKKSTLAQIAATIFASAGLTGVPTAPTAAVGTNTTQIATTAYAKAMTVLSALVSVGTIATGIWQGTKIALGFGGTGADLSATGGAGQVLKQTSAGGVVTVAKVDLTADVTGVLPAANGDLDTVTTRSDTGTVNNWAPTLAGHTLIPWSGASDATFTGLAGVVAGQRVTIKNTGTKVAYFSHNSSSSLAGNRFQNLVTSGPTPVAAGGYITYEGDGTDLKLVNHLQGAPFTRAFSAGNYSVFSSGAWVVTSGEVITESFTLVGRILMCQMFYQNTTVTGAPVVLTIKLPQGYTCGSDVRGATSIAANDNGGSAEVTLTIVGAGIADTTRFGPGRLNGSAWTASTLLTTVEGQAFIPID